MDPRSDPRRLTTFPTSTQASSAGNTLTGTQSKNVDHTKQIPTRPPKRKFGGGVVNVDLKLPKMLATVKNTHRAQSINAKDQNPEKLYKCIHIVDPQSERPYCLAQEKRLQDTSDPCQIVLIRRSKIKAVFSLSKPNLNVLNLLDVFIFENSLFTVFDRPGVPLSDIAMLPDLGVSQIKTISREALRGLCFLSEEGFGFFSIELSDITISACDGRVKVDFNQAKIQGSEINVHAAALGALLVTLMEPVRENEGSTQLSHPERWGEEAQTFIQNATCMTYSELQKVEFLQNSLPAWSLIPFAMNAQVSVFPAEHSIGGQIIDLLEEATAIK